MPTNEKKSPLGASTHDLLLEALPFVLAAGGCRPDARERMMELSREDENSAALTVLAFASLIPQAGGSVETVDGASAQSGGQATGGLQPENTPIGIAQRADAARRGVAHLRKVTP